MDDAKREALNRYPELGVKGSTFNSRYVVRHQEYLRRKPRYFESNDWPIRLADEVYATLHPSRLETDR